MLQRCHAWLHDLLYKPVQIFWICALLAGAGVVFDGTAFRLYGLWQDHEALLAKIEDGKSRALQLEERIQRAQKPEFIERAARDQFDLVQEGDLVFLFSDETQEVPEKTTGNGNQPSS